jgi:hypothetical protein
MNTMRDTFLEGQIMRNGGRRLLVVVGILGIVGILATACAPASSDAAATEPPVVVEENEATGLKQLSLSGRAAERLGIATSTVTAGPAGGGLAVPYEAVLYDEHGETWTYTSPQERVFVRAAITVEEIADGLAILSAGPPVGTAVVTVGTAELWGVESGVGGGH